MQQACVGSNDIDKNLSNGSVLDNVAIKSINQEACVEEANNEGHSKMANEKDIIKKLKTKYFITTPS